MKHSKIIGITLTAIATLLTACTEDVMTALKGGQEITFEVSTKDTNTRASETPQPEIEPVKLTADDGSTYYLHTDITPMPDPVISDAEGSAVTRGATAGVSDLQTNGFVVSAYNSTDGEHPVSAYFYNKAASYDGSSKFTPNAGTAKYWPAGKLIFYAYYPAATASNGLTLGSNASEITYTVPTTIANQPDLMTATATNKQFSTTVTNSDNVPLTFNHALCAIKFQTGTDIAGGTINSITFSNIYKDGKYSLVNNEWDFTGKSAGNLSYTGLNIATTSGTSGTNILTSSSNLLMMIPQSFSNANQKITISFTEANGVSHTLTCTLNSSSWGRGQCITYTVTMLGIARKYLRNPLWYMAETNVKSYASGTKVVTLETSATTGGSKTCYNWSTAMSYFGANHTTTQYDGYKDGDIKDNNNSVYTYHLPTSKEMVSILGFSGNTNIFSSSVAASTVLNNGTTNLCRFGFSDATKNNDIRDISYWGSVGTNLRYAIRFLDTNYCSVWKYQLNTSTSVLTISSRIIDKISSSNTSLLSTTMSTISNAASSYWAEDAVNGVIQRNIYIVGHYSGSNGEGGNGTANSGGYAYYWTTTNTYSGGTTYSSNGSSPSYLGFGSGKLQISETDPGYFWGYPIRLFRVVK